MTWDEYFIEIAKVVALKSKDTTKVGSVIVDADNRIVSTGFNGNITGINEDLVPKTRPEKYFYVIHSELNSILFARKELTNCTLYCTEIPCSNCAKYIAQSGIKTVKYRKISNAKLLCEKETALTQEIFTLAKVKLIEI